MDLGGPFEAAGCRIGGVPSGGGVHCMNWRVYVMNWRGVCMS